MAIAKRNALLERLQQGPVRSSDWPGLVKSGNSLRVQIVKLRRRGYRIDAVPDRRPGEEPRGRPPVQYVLREEPTPPL